MTTTHSAPAGRTTAVTKGAPEVVVPGAGAADGAAEVAERWAADGRRVLAVARDGVLLGLIALADPIRSRGGRGGHRPPAGRHPSGAGER